MVLKHQRLFERMLRIFRMADVRACAEKFDVILNQNTVVQNGDCGFLRHVASVVKSRRMENDVIGLPLPGLAAGIDERRRLLVKRSGLSVKISRVLV